LIIVFIGIVFFLAGYLPISYLTFLIPGTSSLSGLGQLILHYSLPIIVSLGLVTSSPMKDILKTNYKGRIEILIGAVTGLLSFAVSSAVPFFANILGHQGMSFLHILGSLGKILLLVGFFKLLLWAKPPND
jgi:hypothetical protein